MSYKTIIALVIIILVVVGLIIWKAPFSSHTTDTATTTDEASNDDATNTIVANHFYDPATHTHVLEGSITLPTPCHTLQYQVESDGVADTDVTVLFTATSSAEICTQVLSQKIFHVEFKAAENAAIHATLNGQPRELKLSTQGSAIEKL